MTTNSTIDPRKFITGSNVIQIARAIQNEESLDTIKAMLHREKSRLTLNDLLRRSVLDPNQQIPKDTNSNMKVFKSMLPFSTIFVEKTTLYDICIENYSKSPEYYKEVFEFLLERRQPKENFAELVVKLVDYARTHEKFDCGLLDVMKEHKDKININQGVFVSKAFLKSPERSDVKNNEVSLTSKKSFPLSLFDKFDVLYNQPPAQPNDVIMPLGKFLSSASKTSENKELAAFTEAIMPSNSVADPNLTQANMKNTHIKN